MKMNRKGFTLVELMVVLAILGLLAGIGIPQYTKVLERAKIGTDIARVAQVQAAVNALIAECGSPENVTEIPKVDATVPFTDLTGISIVTGQQVELVRDFLDDSMGLSSIAGEMESKVIKDLIAATEDDPTWYIDKTGKVTIGSKTDTNVLK